MMCLYVFMLFVYKVFLLVIREKAQAVDQLKSKAEPEGTSVVDSPQVSGAEKQEEVSAVASDGNVCITSRWLFTVPLS